MLDVKERSIFVHVDLPGQEDHAADLPEEYVYSLSLSSLP